MNHMVEAIRVAGAIQLVIIAVNLPLPGKFHVRDELRTAPRFIRQVFYVHWAYIVLGWGCSARCALVFPPNWQEPVAWGDS